MTAGQFTGYWRDGKRLVMDREALLPDRCIKCNEPANAYRRPVTLTYVGTGTELLVGAIAYAFAKRATIEIGLCERHRGSPAITVALVSVAALLTSILAFTQIRATEIVIPLLATAGLIGGVVGLVYAAVANRVVRAAKITETHIWLKGAGEPFLASIPPAPAVPAGAALPTLATPTLTATDPKLKLTRAFLDARNGAIAFLVGCLITAGTYVLLRGTYIVAWGAVIFGLVRLVGGLRAYMAVPAEHRSMGQALILVAIVGAGAIAGGWVVTDEVQANEFDAALTAAAKSQVQGATLFGEVVNRQGGWTTQDATDMRRVAFSYGHAADLLAASAVPGAYAWYRDGLVRNFRQAVDITTELSALTASSGQSSFDTLIARWTARVKEFNQLQTRFQAQQTH